MTRLIFSGPAQLQIEELHLLRFLERQYDFVAYEVAGFGQDVLLLDYRQEHQNDAPLRGNGRFERPFHLEIWEFGPQHMQIELHDTIRAQAPWTLTLAAANGKTRANRRAFFQRIAPAANQLRSVMTLNRRGAGTAVAQASPAPALMA
jgi:hypothetical protein